MARLRLDHQRYCRSISSPNICSQQSNHSRVEARMSPRRRFDSWKAHSTHSVAHTIYLHIETVLSCNPASPSLILVCLPDRDTEWSSCVNISDHHVSRVGRHNAPNPTAMKDQYLSANHFVNGLNGMLLRGPSG